MQEKRRFGRIPFGSIVSLSFEGHTCKGALHDISLNGAKILLDAPVAPGLKSHCHLKLPLSKELILEFEGEVVHAYESLVGLRFTESDPESFGHLIRLMELNSGDAEKVHDELHHIE
ncbi:PilZ domain-containing protein [Trichloromonas sp.]|uniref:PilZ domain-containing protein n=1 Tax=Trichloromonas sp. TaxID=3069249 RepID=UPI002A3839A5|nr:PilZ domain-containing protein [Trichloromonas sp.]